jgi:hypothetical protein
MMRFKATHQSRSLCHYTHRISAAIKLGFDIRSALFVLHDCDNPRCFNPMHLRPDTQAANNKDCAEKGRQSNYALSEKDVIRLIWSVRSGRKTVAKWAIINKVVYSTALQAYNGRWHNGLAAETHAKCDSKYGDDGNPFKSPEHVEAAIDEALPDYVYADDGIPF